MENQNAGAPGDELESHVPAPGPARAGQRTHLLPVIKSSAVLLMVAALPVGGMGLEHVLVPWLHWSGGCRVFPTGWHVAACMLAIVLSTWAVAVTTPWGLERWGKPRHLALAAVAAGYSLAVSFYQSLALVPLVPLMGVAIAAMGIGILGLAPYWAFAGNLWLAVHLRRLHREASRPRGAFRSCVLAGLGAGMLVVALLDGQALFTMWLAAQACEKDAAVRSGAVDLLQRFGSRDYLLRGCYVAPGWGPRGASVIGDGPFAAELLSTEQVREVFFRVEGRPFNELALPESGQPGLRRQAEDWEAEVVAWSEIGSDTVGGRVRGLSLAESRIQGKVEAGAAVAGLDWTFRFENVTARQREARMHLLLPPGAVASGLSLWVNGRECRAAYSSRGRVKEAYQDVAVRQRRDPALLTTAGPGKVMLQVFPIQPKSSAQVKVQLTCPLFLAADRSWLRLPSLSQRNFDVHEALRHHVRLTADGDARQVRSPWRLVPAPGGQELEASLAPAQLSSPSDATVAFDPPGPGAPTRAAKDTQGLTLQRFEAVAAPLSTGPLVLVVDGSATMAQARPAWTRWLSGLASGRPLTVVLATDGLLSHQAADAADAGRWLAAQRFAGGIDPVPALVLAAGLARPSGQVLWVHGQQAVNLSDPEELRTLLSDSSLPGRLVTFAAAEGPNTVLEALDGAAGVSVAARLGDPAIDLARALAGRRPDAGGKVGGAGLSPSPVGQRPEAADGLRSTLPGAAWLRRFERLAPGDAPGGTVAASEQLSRLWAAAAADELRLAGKDDQARELALAFRLVTPLTGAVVLESAADYAEHGLDPDLACAVGNQGVPEPELVVLILLGMTVLLAFERRRAGSGAESQVLVTQQAWQAKPPARGR